MQVDLYHMSFYLCVCVCPFLSSFAVTFTLPICPLLAFILSPWLACFSSLPHSPNYHFSLYLSFYSTPPSSSSSSAHAANSFSGNRPYSLRNASRSVAKNSSLKCCVTARKFPSNSPALYTNRAGRT